MIKILKNRPYTDRNGKIQTPYLDFNPPIKAPSVQELMMNLETYLEKIPEDERYNLHYTLCEVSDAKNKRHFKSQNVIAFDIDDMDSERLDDYIKPVLSAIGGINANDVAIVCSGRGLHFILGTTETWTDPKVFGDTRQYYKVISDRINRKLESLELPGHTDPAIWAQGHTLRLPGTKNIKNAETGNPGLDFEGECYLIKRMINDIPDMTIRSLAGGSDIVDPADVMNVKGVALGGKYPVDTKGVLSECEFLKHYTTHQDQQREPQWRAMLSVVPHLEGGRDNGHTFSREHPDYCEAETEDKMDRVLACSKPYLCSTIEPLWDGCKSCPHYGKVLSPISIKSKDYIKTKESGFRNIQKKQNGEDASGNPIYKESRGSVNYEDLRRYFEEVHPYLTTIHGLVYTYNGTHWETKADLEIKAFCQDHVKHAPKETERKEFLNLILTTNLTNPEWFDESTFKKINLENGVLDISGDEPILLDHSTDFGFMATLDYDYDPNADCPRFDEFMKEVTCDNEELEDVLLEYSGYSFSNDVCKYDKCLILIGEGSNGKSVFMDTLKHLAGRDAYSSLNAKDLQDKESRAQLIGKLFNLSEETPSRAFGDSSSFKNIVSGGSVPIKILYKNTYSIEPRAKMIFACNDIPMTPDGTKGFLRRLLIVPFDAEFSDDKGNRDVDIREKLYSESSGILNRVLEGYYRLQRQRRFTHAQASRDAVIDYRLQNDPIAAFCEECLVIESMEECHDRDAKDYPEFSYIFKAFQIYLESIGSRRVIEKTTLGKRFGALIPDYKERKKRATSKRLTFLKGVKLMDSSYLNSPDPEFLPAANEQSSFS